MSIRCTLSCLVIFLVAGMAHAQTDVPELAGDSETVEVTGDPVFEFTKHGAIVYREIDGRPLKCDVYIPAGDGPFPAMVAVHGGSWRWGTKFQMLRHAWMMAQRGYVVVAINYRLAPEHKFPAQIQDCKYAVRWMRKNASRFKIDPQRIGGFGYSAGGQLVGLLATSDDDDLFGDQVPDELKPYSSRISAAILGGAPCGFEWIEPDSPLLKYWLGATREQNPDVYRQASPVEYASPDDPPIYFFHGKLDMVVPPSSPRRLYSRLAELGVESQFQLAPRSEHVLAFSRIKLTRDGVDFIDRHLKPNSNDISPQPAPRYTSRK